MPTTKDVKFQYALLFQDDAQGREQIFDFQTWINSMRNVPYKQRNKRVYTNLIRLDKCSSENENDHLIGLRFLRLRDSNIPYKVPEQGEAENLDIADNEYIGESLHIVYDTVTNYFMLQINRNSVGLNSVAAYIQSTLPPEMNPVRFRTFHRDLKYINSQLQHGYCKAIELGFANIDALPSGAFQSLGGALNTAKNGEAHTVSLKIGSGRKKNKTLNNAWVFAVLNDVLEYLNMFSSAKIKYCDDCSSRGKTLNLLDLLVTSTLKVPIEARKTIDFDSIIGMMKQEYSNKKDLLDKMRNKA